eukprot:751557-Hanusia_phi.AAC.1
MRLPPSDSSSREEGGREEGGGGGREFLLLLHVNHNAAAAAAAAAALSPFLLSPKILTVICSQRQWLLFLLLTIYLLPHLSALIFYDLAQRFAAPSTPSSHARSSPPCRLASPVADTLPASLSSPSSSSSSYIILLVGELRFFVHGRNPVRLVHRLLIPRRPLPHSSRTLSSISFLPSVLLLLSSSSPPSSAPISVFNPILPPSLLPHIEVQDRLLHGRAGLGA